ncbi:MAG: preprotein translocase subunit SecA [bacterium]
MANGLQGLLERIFGKKSHRDYHQLKPLLEQVKAVRADYHDLTDEQLAAKREEFQSRLGGGETLDDLLPEAFGVVWEACRRLTERQASWPVWGHEQVWDMVPYDVQIIGGIVLHQGKIAEMATGEGKTLVAIMPLYLNSLAGRGAHLVTVNADLARRDAEWMGGVLRFRGCSVSFIIGDMNPAERREAYRADITYGTNNEFGFDYLRDNMSVHKDQLVHREFFYAIVDEVDSVLIDEARTPLIISGAVAKSTHQFETLNPNVDRLVRQQRKLVNDWVADVERSVRKAGDDDAVTIDDETALKLLRISRGAPKNSRFRKLAQIPGILETIQRTQAAFMRDKAMWEADEDLFYVVEEKHNSVDMTEKGREFFAREDPDFFVMPDLSGETGRIQDDDGLSPQEKAKALDAVQREYALKNEQISNVDQLLRAYSLYAKDDEYVIQDGKILIVDEFTGRLMPGRRFSEGLHQALEAKEGVKVEKETQTLATVTIQNFFRMYDKLSGMTGTAETEEAEFHSIYGLEVVVIPTNEPIRRIDYDDVIYRTKKEKYRAIVEEVARLHEAQLPVLVGTTTVEVSELLSRLLKRRGINHNVLNAKHHKSEAEIVAEAGRRGAVTIATNMAGRGTDIKLAPEVIKCAEQCYLNADEDSAEGKRTIAEFGCEDDVPCGLHIIGTERHESRRIDRQLRGRAGRQGDPGAAVFFLSLEDDLMRLFSPDRIIKVMDRLGVEEGEVITHGMVTKAIEKAQVRVESHNFDIRKHLIKYDDVVNKQREVVYALRRESLAEDDVSAVMRDYLLSVVETIVAKHIDANEAPDNWDYDGLEQAYLGVTLAPLPVAREERLEIGHTALLEKLEEDIVARYEAKEARITPAVARQLERMILLQVIDELWRDHLNELILLRSGIGFRSYAQRDPLVEYKAESYTMFETLMGEIEGRSVQLFFRAELVRQPQPRQAVEQVQTEHKAVDLYSQQPAAAPGQPPQAPAGPDQPGQKRPVQRELPKVGRNDPCPCGSGQKYKKCCGSSGS